MALVVVDAHVHIYECFSLEGFFENAWSNACTRAHGHADPPRVVLCLTETANFHKFSDLKQQSSIGSWQLSTTAEEQALVAGNGEKRIYLIAGSQITTRNKLELLVLGSTRRFADGRSLDDSVRDVQSAGEFVVVPWAVGKWLGERGKQVARTVEETSCFVGDNGGRPLFWPAPSLFKSVRAKGRKVLRGSDPLPIKGEERRVARFGFSFHHGFDGAHPWGSVKAVLDDRLADISDFGSLESPWRFFRNQWLLRKGST